VRLKKIEKFPNFRKSKIFKLATTVARVKENLNVIKTIIREMDEILEEN
jgi:hypothetical protein